MVILVKFKLFNIINIVEYGIYTLDLLDTNIKSKNSTKIIDGINKHIDDLILDKKKKKNKIMVTT